MEYSETSKRRIEEARNAYDKLTSEQKKLVGNYSILTTAEEEYKKQGAEAKADPGTSPKPVTDDVLEQNKTTAKAVEDKINRIGEVKYTETCKVSIDDARAEYERLTDEQKKLVSNYYILLEAEQKYEYMKKEAEEIRRSSNSSVTQIQSNESGASLNVLSSGTEKIYRVGKYNYKVISSRTKTMAVIGVNTKTMKTIKISNKVKISGITYRVIEISPSAFKGCKRVKSVIIGKSVKKIGNKAFRVVKS